MKNNIFLLSILICSIFSSAISDSGIYADEENEWKTIVLGSPVRGTLKDNYYSTVGAGKIREDDKLRIYAGYHTENGVPELHEFEWNGTSWNIIKYPLEVTQPGDVPPDIPINMVIADGRKDGKKRCYLTSNGCARIFEYTFNTNGFDCNIISCVVSNNQYYFGIAVDPVLPSIYYGGSGKGFHEIKYTGITWEINNHIIENTSDINYFNTFLCYGDSRNEGINRLFIYSPGSNAGYPTFKEIEKTGDSWAKSLDFRDIQCYLEAGNCGGFIAALRGYNKKRLYLVSDPGIVEFTWSGNTYQKKVVSRDSSCIAITYADVGDTAGHKDGITCIYALTGDSRIVEYSYNSRWQSTYQMTLTADPYRHPAGNYDWDFAYIKSYEGRGDNQSRMYAVNTSGYLFECSFPPRTFRPGPRPDPPNPYDDRKIPSIMGK